MRVREGNLNEVSNSERWSVYVVIDSLPQAGKVLHSCLPVLHEDLGGQLAPQRVQGVPVCRWDLRNTEILGQCKTRNTTAY